MLLQVAIIRYMMSSTITDQFPRPVCESESIAIFRTTLKRMYIDKQLEESAPIEDEHICNYSCIDSVVNYVLEDSGESV